MEILQHILMNPVLYGQLNLWQKIRIRSAAATTEELEPISPVISGLMFALLLVSSLIALLCIIILVCRRNNKVIKAASWKMNIIMCIGGFLRILLALCMLWMNGLILSKMKIYMLQIQI